MRAGVFVAYWPWFSPTEQVELAMLADRLGLDSVWVAEAWGQDAVSVLGMLAGRTRRIDLGSGLMQIPARKPTATAMAAASLDVLSEGRFRLGLGLSGPQVSEGWYGVPFRDNLRRTREYVDLVRRALARERLTVPMEDGSEGTGLAKPLKLLTRPVQDPLPIYLGSIAPRAVALAGEIADGWLPFMLDPAEPDVLLGPLREGALRAGREVGDIDIAPVVPVAVDEDLAAARDAVRPWLAFYLGSMGAKDKNFYVDLAERMGHGDAARAVQERGLAGDRAGAVAAVSDALVDAATIATTPSGLDARLADYERAGVTTLVGVPCGEDRPSVVRALAAATVTR
ncbi:LLM class flavin-dependent oxidoreductase [Baekduia soli]|uniref:LLM class flavin-dependent oxidoreductase n=1 Tax=Baekduia soli TaxID=496014 RepID=A0A5B8UA30_9ACTN|nr:LLM class flavin-dependent oxidoreductase [Baekduia soli]QEC50043.1 LLM class flavin-dependent oxidoreductase [Baekduia soli]